MRVVRLKHKTGVGFVVILFVLALLWFIKTKSQTKLEVFETIDEDDLLPLPTRSVDFVKIAERETTKKTQEKAVRTQTEVKPRSRIKKVPKPPKRISDGIVGNVNVVKDGIHGDNQHGALGRNNNKQQKYQHPTHSKKATQGTLKAVSAYKIAVLVIVCNRPDAIKRCLDGLLKYRPSAEQFPIIVSQDCGDDKTAQAISNYGNKVKHIKQPDLSDINVPANMGRFQGYYKIARHYKWALGQIFDQMLHDAVLIVEDDLDIAPDFFDYFLATRPLLDEDPTIWCVSAWNDNGKSGMIDENQKKLLYRSDFFPGLGWMMKRSLWGELKVKWPKGFWDDWMRESSQRKDRVCIRPEISRTKTFGRVGVSQGQFFDQHLKHIVLNEKKVDFIHEDLRYLLQKNYDKSLLGEIASLPVLSIEDILGQKTQGHNAVRVTYSTEYDFNSLASKLGAMTDFKAGVPRTGYHGIVTLVYRGIRVFIIPKNLTNI